MEIIDVGGLVGYNFDGTISNSYATGNVTGNYACSWRLGSDLYLMEQFQTLMLLELVNGKTDNVGGLVGFNDGYTNSYATGNGKWNCE